jgi:hypothetical protein
LSGSWLKDIDMGKVEQIERQVEALSAQELESFREWFAAYDANTWDRELQEHAATGKLDALANKALKAHASGTSTKL